MIGCVLCAACGRDARDVDCQQLEVILETPRRHLSTALGKDPRAVLLETRWRDPAIASAATAYAAELAPPGDADLVFLDEMPGADSAVRRRNPLDELRRLCGD